MPSAESREFDVAGWRLARGARGEQDAGVPLIAVNGIELYYESHGTGAPLVVLGGLGLDVSEMGLLTAPLAARFRVIAADNRGAGRSAKPAGPYTIEQMAADVAGLMDRLELASAHVLGLSLGGRIAMALAPAEPAPDCLSDPGLRPGLSRARPACPMRDREGYRAQEASS